VETHNIGDVVVDVKGENFGQTCIAVARAFRIHIASRWMLDSLGSLVVLVSWPV